MAPNPATAWPVSPVLTAPIPFLAAFGAAFVLYWVATVQGRVRLSFPAVLVLGVLARILLFPMPPSDDLARYLWEGRMVLEGVDPYAHAPDDPALEAHRDAAWASINHKHIPAVYPPLAMALFAAVASVSPTILGFKAAFLLLEALGLAVLAWAWRAPAPRGTGADAGTREMPTERFAALYFLNPLLMLETAGHGHYESLPLLFSLGLLGALRRGRGNLSALLLALGAACKPAALALLPLLVLRFPRGRGVLLAATAAAAAVGALALSGSLPTLFGFASRFRHDDWVPFVLRSLLGGVLDPTGLLALSAALLAAAGLALLRLLRGVAPERQALGFLGLFLAFSPTVHPWYVLWLLPFAAAAESRPWLLLTGTAALAYLAHAAAHASGAWRELPWLRLPVLLPPLLAWARCRSRPSAVPGGKPA